MLRDLLFRIRALLRRDTLESELDLELRFHFEHLVEKEMRAGRSRDQAVRRARLLAGGMDQLKEECREARGVEIMETVLQDIRYAVRTLRQKPALTLTAVLTLALGVGANTAIFSLVNGVLLRSLPFPEPERLVRIFFNTPGAGIRGVRYSVPELEDLRNRAGVFESVSVEATASVNLTGGSAPERLQMLVGSPVYLSQLGAMPQMGRLFGPQDETPGFAPSVVISDRLWRSDFGSDPDVLGRVVRLDNDPYEIVGVLPPDFRAPERVSRAVDVFNAAGFSADPAPKPARSTRFMPGAVGRLKPGISLAQAQERLATMAAEIRADYPNDYPKDAKWTIEIQPLHEYVVGNIRSTLLLFQGAVLLIVLIVTLNISNLLLARASGRQQEMAMRAALGASQGRIARQMLTESVVLSAMGGAAGVGIAFAGLKLMLQSAPANIPRLSEVSIDWKVLVFALVVSLSAGLLFGFAPALQSSRTDLTRATREGSRGSGSSVTATRLRDLLVVSELAIAVLLMIGAGLLLRTLQDVLKENPGFDPSHVVTANVNLPEPNDPKLDPYLSNANVSAFYREILRRMNTIPGVQQAAVVSDLPADGGSTMFELTIEGRSSVSGDDLSADYIVASPEYFAVMRIPLVRGRAFNEADQDGKPAVAIIDDATARRYWAGQDAVGRRIRIAQGAWMTIVGVVGSVKHDGLDVDGIPHIYVPIYQKDEAMVALFRDFAIVLKTPLAASALEGPIRQEVQSLDPGLPVYAVRPMSELLDRSLAARRFSARLVGGFAVLSLLLASMGIYGVLAYMVGQRSREIGIRMALGARRYDVLRMFLGRGVALAAIGIATGLILSASAASLMASLLYRVRPHDPLVFVAVPALLLAIAALASYLPARRATEIDPISTLRDA